MIRRNPAPPQQDGFTIVELMIATSILSIILVLASVAMISIGNLYQKGINQSNTQDDVRSIADELSQDLKLNSGQVTTVTDTTATFSDGSHPTIHAICIGSSVRYSYITGYEIGNGTENNRPEVPHILVRDDNTDYTGGFGGDILGSSPGCHPIDLTKTSFAHESGDSELIATKSRLTYFCVTSNGSCTDLNPTSPYTVSIGVAYGDTDLLSSPTGSSPGAVTCSGNTGDQFCATAYITTLAVQRLNGS